MIQKPITIWWGVDTSEEGFSEGIRAEAPIPMLKKFLIEYAGEDEGTKMLSRCPAIINELTNLYGIKPYYDYRLNITPNNDVISDDYDQNFFNSHILVRSKAQRLVSFGTNHIFFAPYEKSLIMSQVAPSLEDNDIANKTLTISGQFDIGKYFRCLDYSFIFKKKISSVRFLREQICFYVRFHTTRPIVFRQFFWDKEINEYYRPMMMAKSHKYQTNSKPSAILSYYYKLFDKFQFKKKIIKIIEKNLTIEARE